MQFCRWIFGVNFYKQNKRKQTKYGCHFWKIIIIHDDDDASFIILQWRLYINDYILMIIQTGIYKLQYTFYTKLFWLIIFNYMEPDLFKETILWLIIKSRGFIFTFQKIIKKKNEQIILLEFIYIQVNQVNQRNQLQNCFKSIWC